MVRYPACPQHVPFITESPAQRGKLAIEHAPFEIVPAQIFFYNIIRPACAKPKLRLGLGSAFPAPCRASRDLMLRSLVVIHSTFPGW
jgi:hypothetical protein